MTDNCNNIVGGHKFFEIHKLSVGVPGSPSYRAAKEGVLVVCASCGEVREAWETGEVIIRPAQPATKPYDPNSTAGSTTGNSKN